MAKTRPATLTPEIQRAAKEDRVDELERLLAAGEIGGEQRVRLVLIGCGEAARGRLLAGCRESASFHRGAVAVAHDDAAEIREAHAREVDWQAPLAMTFGESAVQIAGALGHVASLRTLVELGVDVDRVARGMFGDQTPLVLAMGRGRWEAARVLVDAGVQLHRAGLMKSLPRAPRDLLETMVARGLDWEYVQAQAGLLAEALTPASLRTLMELGLRIDEVALAWMLSTRGVDPAPDEDHVALVRELLRVCKPPASGVVHDPESHTFDLLEVVVERLPLQVAVDLVAAGVVKRKVRVPAGAPDELAKRAWLALPTAPAAGDPALPFADFVGLADGDLTDAAIAAQLELADGRLAFGPLRLGMQEAEIAPISPWTWHRDGAGRLEASTYTSMARRHHSLLVEPLPDGSVFHVLYHLRFNRSSGLNPAPDRHAITTHPEIEPRLLALLGKTSRRSRHGMTWLRGDTRVSYFVGDLGRDPRFAGELALEIVLERHKDKAQRHHKLCRIPL